MIPFINYNNTKNGDIFEGGEDCLKQYRKNRKKLGESWEYFDKKVFYTQNYSKFRTRSFDEINWKQSIVVFGCSHLYGAGLAEEDTITSQLEHILHTPVINLGISGSAVDLAGVNSLILHEHYPRPKAVVQLWANVDRYTDFSEKRLRSYLPKKSGGLLTKNYYAMLDWAARSKHYVLADNVLWREKVPYYQATYNNYTSTTLDIQLLEYKDYARDLVHPGSKSAKLAAEIIAAGLLKQGLVT